VLTPRTPFGNKGSTAIIEISTAMNQSKPREYEERSAYTLFKNEGNRYMSLVVIRRKNVWRIVLVSPRVIRVVHKGMHLRVYSWSLLFYWSAPLLYKYSALFACFALVLVLPSVSKN
jgi:hypothetical protein